MNYSELDHHVRADFFKASGKWYSTAVLDMDHLWYGTCGTPNAEGRSCPAGPHEPGHSLDEALAIAWGRLDRFTEFVMVVLEPYHEHAHPMALRLYDGRAVSAWTDRH